MESNIVEKMAQQYYCDVCDYLAPKKYNFDKHIMTERHLNLCNQQDNDSVENVAYNFICVCGKKYRNRTGLWRHKQKCHIQEKSKQIYIEEKAKNITDKDELIMFLIKENTDFKNLLIEQQNMMMKVIENGSTNNSHNTTHTNSHNKAFNLQFFLNETCKDAMNITDFVNSIKLQLSDLERIGELGYVEGITKIITSNLKALDVTQRPVHCTDKKRETIYVKDEDKWEKEDDERSRIRKAIKSVANNNIKLLPQFREKYPDYKNSYSRTSDIYDKMIIEVMSTEPEKEDKIIRNISNATTIEKIMK